MYYACRAISVYNTKGLTKVKGRYIGPRVKQPDYKVESSQNTEPKNPQM